MSKLLANGKRLLIFALVFAVLCGISSVNAQTGNFDAEREQAIKLVNSEKFTEALPLLEKLSADSRADGQIFLGLGIAYLEKSGTITDKTELRRMRAKARTAVLKVRAMGSSIPQLDTVISTLRPDGSSVNESDNPEAQSVYDNALQPFAAGDYAKAAEFYGKAAVLDPTWYNAALYAGNSFYAMKEYDKAAEWFAKAIAIDPNRETAYRYWADGLMLSGKNKEAEDKFFEAIIAEPYNSYSWRGFSQYAQNNKLQPAHPKIVVPADISSTGDGNIKLTLGTDGKSDDGSFAWIAYGISRTVWQNDKNGKLSEKFARAYPNGKVYRHSLAEEAEALRSVLSGLKNGSKEVKTLDSSLVKLKKLDDAGLLEAYILLSRASPGIRADYEAYRLKNRDKLKRYLAEVILRGAAF